MVEPAKLVGAEELPTTRFLTYRMARVQAKLNAQASRLLREVAGLSLSQWRILSLIGSRVETTSSELTRISAMDKGLFSRKLKTLIGSGLVLADPDLNDSRVQRLRLTANGADLYRRTLPRMQARQQALRDRLTPEELRVFVRALDKLELAAEELPG